jgi:hypothetical protein
MTWIQHQKFLRLLKYGIKYSVEGGGIARESVILHISRRRKEMEDKKENGPVERR